VLAARNDKYVQYLRTNYGDWRRPRPPPVAGKSCSRGRTNRKRVRENGAEEDDVSRLMYVGWLSRPTPGQQ